MPRSTCKDHDEAFLGKWLTRQRRKHTAGRLSPDRNKRLIDIGALVPNNEPEFMEKLEACAAFIEKNGRTPSSTANDLAEKGLYYWRAGQQHLRSIGKLKTHRLQLLEERGIFQTAFEHEWRSFFNRLERFVKEQGRPPIRFSDNPEEARLGQWRQQQFALYKKGKIDKERARMLESLGIATTVTNINWNNSFRQLQAFVKARSMLPSRFSDNEDEKQLARWLETQRQLIKIDDQPPRRRCLIESLELPENRLEDCWDKMLKEVQTFVTRHGRLPSTNAKARKERSLALWCYRQRTELDFQG